MIHQVAVIDDLSIEEVERMDMRDIIKRYDETKRYTRITDKYQESIEIEGVQLHLLPFTRLTLGQFIDLETYVNEGYFENIHKIAAVIYLQMSGGGMTDECYEEYSLININYRSMLMEDVDAQSIVPACHKYLTFRKNLFDSYTLFHNPFEVQEGEELTDEELEELEAEKQAYESKAGNQWQDLINLLAGGDITKFDAVLRTNVFMSLNQAEWLKSNQKSNTL